MSFVSNKQQRLIDDTVLNHVKYYDKHSSQYLKLRQEIFQLNSDVNKDADRTGTNEFKVKTKQLLYELERVLESYTNHLSAIKRTLESKKTITPPYVPELKQNFDGLTEQATQLQKEIKDIKEIQKPLLDKMNSLVKSFETTTKAPRAHHKTPEYDQNSVLIDLNALVFTEDEIRAIFDDVNLGSDIDSTSQEHLSKYLDDQLQNGKLFDRLGNKKFQLKLNNKATTNSKTTIAEYDELITNTLSGIEQLLKEGVDFKESWSTNATKLQVVSDAIDAFDEEMAD